MKLKIELALLAGIFMAFTAAAQEKYHAVTISPTDSIDEIIYKAANVVPYKRQLDWQKKELTAFIHFGINTFTNREWGSGKEDPKIFNPKKLNAEQWVSTLKDAGFKQVILTCKHHDGFCLWPTATTNHSVKSSAWKNGSGDVVKEVSQACAKYGVGFGVYLSPWDMNASCYGTPQYNDFFVKQLTELLTNYGKVEEVWFDGACGEGPNGKRQEYDFNRWYKLIRELQNDAVIAVMGPDVRWVGTETGRGRETEWSVVPNNQLNQESVAANSQQDSFTKPMGDMRQAVIGGREQIKNAKALVWYPAEVDVSIRPGWFYHKNEDSKVKTPRELVDIYLTSVGMNGVLLLNIPPDTNGLLNENDIRSLIGFGQSLNLVFAKNLACGGKIKSGNGRKIKRITDGKYNTACEFNLAQGANSFTIEFKKRITFNMLGVQENLLVGQRVERFMLEALLDNGEWAQIAHGTTVGYKRLIEFDKVSAKKIKFTVLESRLNPSIAEFGLFLRNN